MRKLLFALVFVLAVSSVNAQAFEGKEDMKFQIGANFQDNGTGIVVAYDYGLGENFSLGLSSSYVLGVEELISVTTLPLSHCWGSRYAQFKTIDAKPLLVLNGCNSRRLGRCNCL